MLTLPAALVAMAIAGNGTGQSVLLDFYSDSCLPCRGMMPTVDQLAAEGYPVQRINVMQYPDVARPSVKFRRDEHTFFVMVVDGRDVGRVVGGTSLGRLLQLCSLGRPAAPPSAAAAPPARSDAAPSSATVPVVPISYSTPTARQAVSDADLLAASVRIRVEDRQGHNCGSGTIIDALPGGEALVLTCGHLFRDSEGKGKIELDLFGPSPAAHVTGRLISYDLERDVAFVAFRPQRAVTVARVAPRGYVIRPGDAVASVGCDNGDDPTVNRSQVNVLDRFLDSVEQRLGHKIEEPHAPWNVEVAGQPVEGRSGGGLFSADGLVIGICSAAEPPKDNEGIYSGLGAIHTALDEKRMTFVYQRPAAPPTLVAATGVSAGGSFNPEPTATAHAADPFAAARGGASAVLIPYEHSATASGAPPATTAAAAPPAGNTDSSDSPRAGTGLSGGEQTTLDEIRRKLREGAEVVCIVRDRNDPKSQSEVFTLDRASPIFVNQLARASQAPSVPHETALEVPKRRTPIVEWDAAAGGFIHQNPLPR